MDRIFAWTQDTFGSTLNKPAAFNVQASPQSAYRMKIVPALSDNYMYLIIANDMAVAIDPVDSEKILSLCKDEDVQLAAVLTTHYHSDHSGGNAKLASAVPNLEIIAGEKDADRTPAVTRSLAHGEEFSVAGLPFRCLATPCHTKGHVAFFLDAKDGQPPALFSGDTLFVAGCGRFMEGGPGEMRASLSLLLTLPQDSRVFCGHEYTVGNLKYAASLEPSNEIIACRLREAEEKVLAGRPTVPSTLAEELEHNPFLRTEDPNIAEAVGCPP